MPEAPNPLTPQNQIDWHGMLHDLEKSVERMSDALVDLRTSVRRIIMAEAWLPAGATSPVVSAASVVASEPPAAAEPVAVPATESAAAAAMEISAEDLVDTDHAHSPEEAPEPIVEIMVAPTAAEETASVELVQRFVDEMREKAPEQLETAAPVAQDDEAAREAVRRSVEQTRMELSGYVAPVAPTPPAPATPAASSDDDAREAVRRAVEEARAELAGGHAVAPVPPSAAPVMPERQSDEEQDAREAVRRAVEQARAELAGGGIRDAAPATPPPPRPMPQRPVNPTHLLPTLTIEDPESRVELTRVYALLQALGVAAQSSLLNYTSRQVSVMLSADAARITPDAFVSAVSSTLGRESTASIDGANVIVVLGATAGEKEEAA